MDPKETREELAISLRTLSTPADEEELSISKRRTVIESPSLRFFDPKQDSSPQLSPLKDESSEGSRLRATRIDFGLSLVLVHSTKYYHDATDQAEYIFEDWGFDILRVHDSMLHDIGLNILLAMGATEKLNIPNLVCDNFVTKISKLYRQVPYHSFRHALDVTHSMYMFLTVTEARKWYTDLEKFAMVVAAMVHDVDHPGLSNSLLVALEHHLALQYNDASVLENHHAATAFRVLQDTSTALFAGLQPELRREVRKVMLQCVMATDMDLHGHLMEQLALRLNSERRFDPAHVPEDAAFFSQLLIKACDLSNTFKCFESSRMWSMLSLIERMNQVDKEKAAGLRTASVDFLEEAKVSGPQFLANVAVPMYTAFTTVLPSAKSVIMGNLENFKRRTNWDMSLKDGDARKLASEITLEKALRSIHGIGTVVFSNGTEIAPDDFERNFNVLSKSGIPSSSHFDLAKVDKPAKVRCPTKHTLELFVWICSCMSEITIGNY